MKRFCFILFVLCFPFIGEAESLLPSVNGYIVRHNYYTLSYIEEHEQAEWVSYWLLSGYVNGSADRGDDFRRDFAVKTGSADLADYKSSGYDRGHLCPAADMKQSSLSMSETFFMSNMSPQVPSFNRGAWKRLEEQVRKWALKYDSLFVVTGPVFKDNVGSIGRHKVTVPGYYYKVLYSEKKNIMQAFLLPNKVDVESNWRKYSISVDSLENLTNIDFFVEMEDSVESKLESANNYLAWFKTFGAGVSVSKAKGKLEVVKEPASLKDAAKKLLKGAIYKQCKGVSKSTGKRCRNKTNNPNGYCHLHQSQAPK